MIKYSLICLVVALSCRSFPATESAATLDDFSRQLERLRGDGHIHAISAVIVKDQSIVWSRSFGGEAAGQISDTTVFHLASLTKPFASTVILQLVDEGKVSLDD